MDPKNTLMLAPERIARRDIDVSVISITIPTSPSIPSIMLNALHTPTTINIVIGIPNSLKYKFPKPNKSPKLTGFMRKNKSTDDFMKHHIPWIL